MKEKLMKIGNRVFVIISILLYQINTAYAGKISSSESVVTVKKGKRVLSQSGGQNIGELTNYFGDWLTKIGGLIMFAGAIMFALGWTRDDADSKTRGLMVLAAGALLVALRTFKWI